MTIFVFSTVSAVRKVTPNWSQKTITQYCLSLFLLFHGESCKPIGFSGYYKVTKE